MRLSPETIFQWEQDRDGGDHGVLTLWPGTHRELKVDIQNFRVAHALGMAINGVKKDAFEAGRRSMQDEIARIRP